MSTNIDNNFRPKPHSWNFVDTQEVMLISYVAAVGSIFFIMGAVCDVSGLMIAGSAIDALALIGAVVKADHYLRRKRLNQPENIKAHANYIPASTKWQDWETLRAKNPHVKIAPIYIVGGDPDACRNSTVDDLNRPNNDFYEL